MNRLIWTDKSNYVEPFITSDKDDDLEKLHDRHILYSKYHMEQMIDRMFDPSYKKIMMPTRQEAVIKQVEQYYILFPCKDGEEFF